MTTEHAPMTTRHNPLNTRSVVQRSWYCLLTRAGGLTRSVVYALSACLTLAAAAQAQPVAWIQRTVSGPSPRGYHAMAYDSARGVTVLFGGAQSGGNSADTWEWDGTTWTQRNVGGPSVRSEHAMAFDTVRGRTVLFGGADGANGNTQTWEWSGTAWMNRPVSGPSTWLDHPLAFDVARGVSVLFGGCCNLSNQTWEWNGTVWTQRVVSGPPARSGHAMAYDIARGVTVLFGGYTDPNTGAVSGETWEWNGTTWMQRVVTGPSPRNNHAMVYDAARGVSVLFGGSSGGDETWEWNGSVWTRRATNSPGFRQNLAMTYDSTRSVIVLFGGQDNTGYTAETWELCAAPSIAAQPASQTACGGTSASVSIAASGSTPRTYLWRKGGVAIATSANPSAATAMLTLANVTRDDAASYDCVVTNACGSATSDPATLTVNVPPSISPQPSPATTCSGVPATLTSAATGSGTLGYQWQVLSSASPPMWINVADGPNAPPGVPPFNATGTQTVTLTCTETNGAGDSSESSTFRCIVSNSCGSVTSDPATLTVNSAPAISQQPAPVTTCPSATASFAATGTGSGPFTYHWQTQVGSNWIDLSDGSHDAADGYCADIAGSGTPTLSVVKPPRCFGAGQPHQQACRCIVTNTCGSATSNPATWTICPADFNCSGTLSVNDIFGFLSAWFAADPRADFNGTGGTNIQDIFDFLAAWFAGC